MHSLTSVVAALAVCHWAAASPTRQYPTRDNAKTVSLPVQQHDNVRYLANITIGTPPQNVTVEIDTGSADLYVFANDLKCDGVSGGCQGSSFDSASSSTFNLLQQGMFNASFGDNSTVIGDYITETVSIGGAAVKNMTMGLVHSAGGASQIWGIMGIGPVLGESIASQQNSLYWNLPYWMAAQGIINEPVFSMDLGDIKSQDSTLLFGGVDTSRYVGDLIVTPAFPNSVQNHSVNLHYNVLLTSVGWSDAQGTHAPLNIGKEPLLTVLDSGSEVVTLPPAVAEEIYKQFNASLSPIPGAGAFIPCSAADENVTFTFQIDGTNGPLIRVPIAEFVTPVPAYDPQPPKSDVKLCRFEIIPDTDIKTVILGDPFLRSAYVVFDAGHSEIAIAQANTNATNDSKIVPLSAAATWDTSAGLVPATEVIFFSQTGHLDIPGKTLGLDAIASDLTGATTASARTATATGGTQTGAAATATGTNGGGSGPGGATADPSRPAAAPTSNKASGAGAGAGAAATSSASSAPVQPSKGAAAGIAPPAMGSLLAVTGGSVMLVLAGLGGTAAVFMGL